MTEASGRPGLAEHRAMSVEAAVAVEPPREYRLHPRDRVVAFTAEAAGARQLFTMPLRGGAATQITASERDISDPRWAPDGRRLVFVRSDELWVVEADGSRLVRADAHPAGARHPRWSPDGGRIAFLSRRRGWSQIWVVDAPVPRRGRPPLGPRRPPEAVAITSTGWDVETFGWSPDGSTIAVSAVRGPDLDTCQVILIDVATGAETIVAGAASWDVGPTWAPDGALLHLTDADGWFQVVRRAPDGRERTILTSGPREHGTHGGDEGWRPLASPDGSRFAHVEIHDGLVDLVVAPMTAAAPLKRPRGRPPKNPRVVAVAGAGAGAGERIQPFDGQWITVGWLHDGAWLAAVGQSETRPPDLWLLPIPGVAPDGARPRQVIDSRPAVLAAALAPSRTPAGERVAIAARDGLRIEGTLWRPAAATGRRGGARVPLVVHAHGGPTSQSLRNWQPLKRLLVHEGFAFLDVDFRGSDGYGRAFRRANIDEWGHADVQDVIDFARWALDQPWCDGRLAIHGGSYGGYLVLCALVEEPGMWRAGVDYYGDSEIAESYRHGDRVGRLDLHRQMGSPDDPEKAPLFRRGSPLYRAERIEAPLLLLHGRKDLRVVPLMTEKMVEALKIEGKHHEVVWYDDEGHGWKRRENRRDSHTRVLKFLKRHVMGVETAE